MDLGDVRLAGAAKVHVAGHAAHLRHAAELDDALGELVAIAEDLGDGRTGQRRGAPAMPTLLSRRDSQRGHQVWPCRDAARREPGEELGLHCLVVRRDVVLAIDGEPDEDDDQLSAGTQLEPLADLEGLGDDRCAAPAARIVELDRPALLKAVQSELPVEFGDVARPGQRLHAVVDHRRVDDFAERLVLAELESEQRVQALGAPVVDGGRCSRRTHEGKVEPRASGRLAGAEVLGHRVVLGLQQESGVARSRTGPRARCA